MPKKSDLHTDLFNWLRENNLPENEVSRDEKEWFFNIAVGFKELGMEKPMKQELRAIGYYSKREWSEKYGFIKANLIQYVDCICIIGKRAWILEVKKEPNHAAIGQVLVYSDLFKEDYPMFENIKLGIVCREPSPLNVPTCNKLGISIFISSVDSFGFKGSPKIKKEFKYPEPSDNFFIIHDS